MGWSSGSRLAGDVWATVQRYVPAKSRKRVAGKIIDLFEQEDADDFGRDDPICKAAGMYQEDDEDEGWDYKPHVS